MTNAIFTASESSAYDDLIERHYHFPRTYLRQVEEAVGDWIIYYEPRRSTNSSGTGGRQAYFAIAQVTAITPDPVRADHYYAQVRDFLEFDQVITFREGAEYRESVLQKADGSTNKGAFGRSVRLIPREEFERIAQAGLYAQPQPWELANRVAEPVPEYVARPIVEQVSLRKFRDTAFRRHVRNAYANTWAVSNSTCNTLPILT